MKSLDGLVNKATRAVTKIKGPKIVKTVDEAYTQAKETLKLISLDVNKMITYIQQMNKNLKKLSKSSLKLGEDVDNWFSDGPEESQLKVKTTLSFAKHFYALTNNFLMPHSETHVISLLTQFQGEIIKLQELKEKRSEARKEYDKSRALVTFLTEDQNGDQTKMIEALGKLERDTKEYRKLNASFIKLVQNIDEKREVTLELPFKNLLCLTSQFMLQIFTEIQKFRTTFPPDLFQFDPQLASNSPPESNQNQPNSPPESNQNQPNSPPESNHNQPNSPPESNQNQSNSPPESNQNQSNSPPESNQNQSNSPEQNNSTNQTELIESPNRQ